MADQPEATTVDNAPKTALETLIQISSPGDELRSILQPDLHPQARTAYFHEVFDAPIYYHFNEDGTPKVPDNSFPHMSDERVALRVAMLLSEVFELIEQGLGLNVGFGIFANGDYLHMTKGSDNKQLTQIVLKALQRGGKRNLIKIIDGLADINVVNNGFGVELGINLDVFDIEVLASNLTKMGTDGKPIISDGSNPDYPAGKIMKGPHYMPPQIALMLGLNEDGTPIDI